MQAEKAAATTTETKTTDDASGEFLSVITDWLGDLLKPFEGSPLIYAVVVSGALLLLLWLAHLFFRFAVIRPLVGSQLLGRSKWLDLKDMSDTKVLSSISSLLSIGLIAFVIGILPSLQAHFNSTAGRIAGAFSVFFLAQLIVRSGRLLDVVYSRLPSVDRPGALRGYVTVGSFLAYITAAILIVSIMMDKSPIYFLTGLGAISAILLIVFRDTLLSMFANVIVTTGDLVRVNDWISVPESNANGYVIDVSLNVVKVQNFDKTISVLPTYTLVQESFVNYRSMYNSGGRRIKRSILLDQRTIRPLSSEEISELADIPLMDKALELEKTATQNCVEVDRITNSGLFRQYVTAYLQDHPKILKDNFTMMVRHLQPTPNGLPLEIYCFVDDTRWAQYEGIQATIFDQLLSMIPVFGLRVWQEESDFAEPNPQSRLVSTAPGDYPAAGGPNSS